MTRSATARVAGFTYLFYAAIGICSEVLMHRARGGGSAAAQLAHIGEHAIDVRLTIVIAVLESFCALVLAVTLYGLTREIDLELATMVLACRVAEGVLGSLSIPNYLGLLWLSMAGADVSSLDSATTTALRAYLMMPGSSVPLGALFFAVGSGVFSYLLLRGGLVPVWMAWLGLFASMLLSVALPLQVAGFSTGLVSGYYQWMPALLFQVVLALWFLAKGVSAPQATSGGEAT